MRYAVLIFLLGWNLWANEATAFFAESPENQVLCKVSQYAYKVVTHKNAELVELHGHDFFKLKDENLYILKAGCYPLDNRHEAIIF